MQSFMSNSLTEQQRGTQASYVRMCVMANWRDNIVLRTGGDAVWGKMLVSQPAPLIRRIMRIKIGTFATQPLICATQPPTGATPRATTDATPLLLLLFTVSSSVLRTIDLLLTIIHLLPVSSTVDCSWGSFLGNTSLQIKEQSWI